MVYVLMYMIIITNFGASFCCISCSNFVIHKLGSYMKDCVCMLSLLLSLEVAHEKKL